MIMSTRNAEFLLAALVGGKFINRSYYFFPHSIGGRGSYSNRGSYGFRFVLHIFCGMHFEQLHYASALVILMRSPFGSAFLLPR